MRLCIFFNKLKEFNKKVISKLINEFTKFNNKIVKIITRQ